MEQKVFIVDCRYFDCIQKAFGDEGIFLPSIPCHALQEPVSCHPDMVLYPAQDGTLICAPEVFCAYQKILSPFGRTLVQGEKSLFKHYPSDVAYNVLNVGSYAFARWDCVDEKVKAQVEKNGVTTIRIAQGYSRCSTLGLNNALITADDSIEKAAKGAGLSVLKIRPGHICLPGYDYGFIGGASGLLSGKTVVFAGDLSTHPDGEKIRQFLSEKGFFCREIPGMPLTDVGTILRV